MQALCAPNYELANQFFEGANYVGCINELDKVRTKYDSSFITYPGDRKLRLRCNYFLGQWIEVIQYDIAPLRIDADVDPMILLAYLELNDFNKAKAVYSRRRSIGRYSGLLREELGANPSTSELRFWAHSQLGIDYCSHGGKGTSKGLQELLLANRIRPESPTCLWVQARCYYELKKPQQAKAIYQKLTRSVNAFSELARAEIPDCDRAIAKLAQQNPGQ
jgi:tetratricopeptide (TPR) repeat protein